ncbi:hypothetical protein SRABI70_04408 [Pseudomonas sp. Bi70]|jgi:hypothetical protein|nr:hypothetical protein SRABI70_04408 [Pseudomonas sp. Bi70]
MHAKNRGHGLGVPARSHGLCFHQKGLSDLNAALYSCPGRLQMSDAKDIARLTQIMWERAMRAKNIGHGALASYSHRSSPTQDRFSCRAHAP